MPGHSAGAAPDSVRHGLLQPPRFRLIFARRLRIPAFRVGLRVVEQAMIASLPNTAIVDGNWISVSRLSMEADPDQREWLSQVNSGVLKLGPAATIIRISSINVLKTAVNAANLDADRVLFGTTWPQVGDWTQPH